MKILKKIIISILIIISFQSLSISDDISEFEIEGLSVNNSLLDFYSISEINNSLKNATYYKNKKFVVIFVKKNSEMYDRIQVTLKTKDKLFKIYSAEGIIDFNNNIKDCLLKKKQISNDLKSMFNKAEIVNNDAVYEGDYTGNSFTYGTWFFFQNGGYASVNCTKMGKEVRETNGWTDELAISITNKELEDFLRNEAY